MVSGSGNISGSVGTNKSSNYTFENMKLYLCLIRHDVIKTYGTADAKLHSFLPSAPDGGEWSA